jgi:hypothetical protein
MTQAEKILDYMERHGSITPLEAVNELGVMRLGARIFDLKESGIEIVTERVTEKNRFGEVCNFARYRLEK